MDYSGSFWLYTAQCQNRHVSHVSCSGVGSPEFEAGTAGTVFVFGWLYGCFMKVLRMFFLDVQWYQWCLKWLCEADAKAIRAESELPDLWNDASHAPEPWQLCRGALCLLSDPSAVQPNVWIWDLQQVYCMHWRWSAVRWSVEQYGCFWYYGLNEFLNLYLPLPWSFKTFSSGVNEAFQPCFSMGENHIFCSRQKVMAKLRRWVPRFWCLTSWSDVEISGSWGKALGRCIMGN